MRQIEKTSPQEIRVVPWLSVRSPIRAHKKSTNEAEQKSMFLSISQINKYIFRRSEWLLVAQVEISVVISHMSFKKDVVARSHSLQVMMGPGKVYEVAPKCF